MKKNKKLIIIGDGEFASIAYEYFTFDSDYEVLGFAVEKEFYTKQKFYGLPIYVLEELESKISKEDFFLYAAITFVKLNRVRERIYQSYKEKGFKFATYISSKAFVWRNAKIGENTFIFENNVIQPFVEIGSNVVLWSGNHIGHQTVIEDHCFLSSHVVVSGYCQIGSRSFIGVNATFANNLNIGKDNFIAMATAITRNTEDNQVYKGNPCVLSNVSAKQYFKVL
jgi:sugar O-acyltransferase (sialic acid O-acetyltransferase NeuD family)